MRAGSRLKLSILKESSKCCQSSAVVYRVVHSKKVVYKEKSRIELSVEKSCTELLFVYSKKPSSRKIVVKQ